MFILSAKIIKKSLQLLIALAIFNNIFARTVSRENILMHFTSFFAFFYSIR